MNKTPSFISSAVTAMLATIAQASTQSDTAHTCSTAMTRLTTATVDWETLKDSDTPWNDPDFPKSDALYWKDQGEQNDYGFGDIVEGVGWTRIPDLGNVTLYGSDDLNPNDMIQGQLGNCWIISAVSAVAEHGGRIKNLILNDSISQSGIYGVNMYALGVPYTEYVDDWIPTKYGSPLFANLGADGSVWPSIVEKAFAKRYGNYQHMDGGWMATGVSVLTGSPFYFFDHNDSDNDIERLWQLLSSHDLDTDIMTASTACEDETIVGDQECQTPQNLAANHAYTVLGVTTIEPSGRPPVRLVKVRNPWGENGYNGPWSAESGDWTDELRAEVDNKLGPRDEGVFYMDISTYKNNFSDTHINEDVTDWDLSYFLMLGDTKTETVGDAPSCAACTQHIVEVTNPSDESQKVFVGAHIWQDRTYSINNNSCYDATAYDGDQFSIQSLQSGDTKTFNSEWGVGWLNGIEIPAGETYRFAANFDWTREEIVKDWSVTAWGTKSKVEVRHADGIESQHLPHIGRQGSDEETDNDERAEETEAEETAVESETEEPADETEAEESEAEETIVESETEDEADEAQCDEEYWCVNADGDTDQDCCEPEQSQAEESIEETDDEEVADEAQCDDEYWCVNADGDTDSECCEPEEEQAILECDEYEWCIDAEGYWEDACCEPEGEGEDDDDINLNCDDEVICYDINGYYDLDCCDSVWN